LSKTSILWRKVIYKVDRNYKFLSKTTIFWKKIYYKKNRNYNFLSKKLQKIKKKQLYKEPIITTQLYRASINLKVPIYCKRFKSKIKNQKNLKKKNYIKKVILVILCLQLIWFVKINSYKQLIKWFILLYTNIHKKFLEQTGFKLKW